VNARLYPASGPEVNDGEALVQIFEAAFLRGAEELSLTPAARRVLATAAALFFERGAVATSVRDLTAACGLTPGALYNHFASKDDLLDTIVRFGHSRMRRRVDDALAACGPEPRARLEAFVGAYVAGHLDGAELAQVVRREYLHLSPERRRAVVAERRRFRGVLEDILEAGQDVGAFEIIGGEVAGQAVMILDLGSRTSEWFVARSDRDRSDLIERYVEAARRLVGVRARD